MSLAEGKYVITVDATGAYSSLQKLGKEFENVNKTAKSSIGDYARAGASLAGLGASAAGAYFSFNNLDKIQIRMAKTARVAEEQQLKVNKMLKEGKQDTEEYQFELRQLQEMQERVKASSDDLTQAQVALGFQIGGMILQIPVMVSSLSAMFAGHTAAAGAAVIQTGANVALAGSTRILTASLLTNPLFIIPTIAAIATGTALIASNFGGLRDTLFGVTDAVNENTRVTTAGQKIFVDVDTTLSNSIPTITSYGNALDPGLTSKFTNLSGTMNTFVTQVQGMTQTLNGFVAVTNEQASKIFEGLQKEGPGFEGMISGFRQIEKLQNNINSDLELALKFNVESGVAVRALTVEYKDEAKAAGLTTKELEFQIKHQLRLIELEERKEVAKRRAELRDKDSKKNEVRTLDEIAESYQTAAKEARDFRTQLKLNAGMTFYEDKVTLDNLKVLLELRDKQIGLGDVAGADLIQELINEKYTGESRFGTSELLTLQKFGVRSFGKSEMSLMGLPTDRTIRIAQDKHTASVSKANAAFAAAGQKSLSKKQAGKRRGGHSKFRQDTVSGRRHNVMEAFYKSTNISQLTDEQQEKIRLTLIGAGSPGNRLRNVSPEMWASWVTSGVVEARALYDKFVKDAYMMTPEYMDYENVLEHNRRVAAMSTGVVN